MDLKDKLIKLQGKKELLLQQQEQATKDNERIIKDVCLTEKAQVIANKVAQSIQSQLSFKLQSIVQNALDAVFEDSCYEFTMDFTTKSNRSQVDFYLKRNGHRIDMLDGNGGGLIDIVGFALRLAVWSLGKTDNTFIMDEPFKNLSVNGGMRQLGADILKELVHKMKLQLIMVTNEPQLTEIADKLFYVEKIKNHSRVKEIAVGN